MEIIAKVETIIAPAIEAAGMELVDVQYVPENGKKVLRVFIDKEGGVRLADCEAVSRTIGDLIDEADILPQSYVLEVSSPGIDRVLKKEKDFVRFQGYKARITMQLPLDGQRNFLGPIASVQNGCVTLNDVTGKVVVLPIVNIARARLDPEM